jgi:response regulator RpfG family c-di-GMP phosphodiesterase
MSTEELLLDFEGGLASYDQPTSRRISLQMADAMLEAKPAEVASAAAVGMRICKALYLQARAFDAIPIALAANQRAREIAEPALIYQTATACGLLSGDSSDVASAVEYHNQALDITSQMSDQVGASRSWNNIASALCAVGRYELAEKGYRHGLEQIEKIPEPLFSRYSGNANLAHCALHLNQIELGLRYSRAALDELEAGLDTPEVTPFYQLLLRRNMVRLMVAGGDIAGAEQQVHLVNQLSRADGGSRAALAAATSQAVVEIALGRIDIATTRLDACLSSARANLPALRDTLACLVRADEAIGDPARALLRLQELSALAHRHGAETAGSHLALADWRSSLNATFESIGLNNTRVRLEKRRGAAQAPAIWPTLVRLACGISLQVDPSAEHGGRVGALSRMLAQAAGIGPLHALEIGLAAQVHDIGIAVGHENLVGRTSDQSQGYSAENDPAHCDAGWQILCDDSHPRLVMAREIAKYHHAWWNGNGFPSGISGQSIPVHARICAVADAYDTLMHDQASNARATIGVGLDRLQALSGSRLDPMLVERFSEALRSETRNEGIELDSANGLINFKQLIKSLSSVHRHL